MTHHRRQRPPKERKPKEPEPPVDVNVTPGVLAVLFVPIGLTIFFAIHLPSYANGKFTDTSLGVGCLLLTLLMAVGFSALKRAGQWRRYAILWGLFLCWGGVQYLNVAADHAAPVEHQTTVVSKRVVNRWWRKSRQTAYVVEVKSWNSNGTYDYDVANRGTYDAYVEGGPAFITTSPGFLGLEWIYAPLSWSRR